MFSAEEWKALEYAFPSVSDEYSDRKYQLVFNLRVTRTWNKKQVNTRYHISSENDISIIGLIVRFWGLGLSHCRELLANRP